MPTTAPFSVTITVEPSPNSAWVTLQASGRVQASPLAVGPSPNARPWIAIVDGREMGDRFYSRDAAITAGIRRAISNDVQAEG